MSRTISAYLLCLTLFLLPGCTEPLRQSCFKNVDGIGGWTEDQTISLSLDLADNSQDNILNLCACASEDAQGEEITVYLTFVSPDGESYLDTASLRIEKTDASDFVKNGTEIQILWPYMKIGKLNKEGRWKILLDREKKDKPVYRKIRGMGVSVSR